MTNLESGQGESIVAELHEGNVEAVAALAYLAEAFEANPTAAFAKTAADWRQWLVDEGYTPDSVVEVIRQVLASELDAAQQEALFNNVAAGLTLGEVAKRIHAQSPTLVNTLLRHVDHGAALQAAVLGVSGGSGKLLNAPQTTGSSLALRTVAKHLQNEFYESADSEVKSHDPNGLITPKDQIERFIGSPAAGGLNAQGDQNLTSPPTVRERIRQDALQARTTIDTVNSGGNANEYPVVSDLDIINDLRFSSADPVELNSEKSRSSQSTAGLGNASAEREVERYDLKGDITPRDRIQDIIGSPGGVNSSDRIIIGDLVKPVFPLEFITDVLRLNKDFSSLESKYPEYSSVLKQIQNRFDNVAREDAREMLEEFDTIKEDVEKEVVKLNEILVSLSNRYPRLRSDLKEIQFEFHIDIIKSIKSFVDSRVLKTLEADEADDVAKAEVAELNIFLEEFSDKLAVVLVKE